MANQTLFATLQGTLLPKANAVNSENAPAYALSPMHALAQYAATGCFSRTFYADAQEQLDKVLELCAAVEPEFIARVAIYARERAYLKDAPALLCAVLSVRAPKLHEAVFPRVIDHARMLRTYVQILRSGVVGRKSLGSAPKRLVREWLERQNDAALFAASAGQSPSLADIVKMVHPQPATPARESFYGYLLGRPHDGAALPPLVRDFERFKLGEEIAVPDVPFAMLTALPLSEADWAEIAARAPWQTTRMNLNTFARHGVFERPEMVSLIASRLRDPKAIARARVFPYQLLAAYLMAGSDVPLEIRDALQDAMELATANVPAVPGKIYVCPDVSGSMRSPITGHRKGATTAVRCVDVAALVTSALVRKNPSAEVIPFEQDLVRVDVNPRDSIMTNAERLASVGGGGTNCSAPLYWLNRRQAKGDLVIYVSDNESWVDAGRGLGTALLAQWNAFRGRNPKARLVCIDLQPNHTTQAVERHDVLNVGGFSDQVFEIVAAFAAGELHPNHWVGLLNAIEL